jgi:predicted RNase H-like HicB family nuclease
MNHHYSISIRWSDEDQAYLVVLPEFGAQPQTHGDTYEEAVLHAQQVLDLLIETYQAEGWKLPDPAKHISSVPV